MFEAITEKIGSATSGIRGRFKRTVFGANNEKLDFIMDSFLKLEPNQRSAFLVGAGSALGIIVVGVFWLYFSRIGALETELNDGFAALYRLQGLKQEYVVEGRRYNAVVDNVKRKTDRLSLKPFVEKLAQDTQVAIRDLSEKKEDMPSDITFSSKMKYNTVEVDFNKVSIPRLLKFLIEVERSKKYLTIKDLEVRARYRDRLFFEAEAKVRGYTVTQ